MGRSQALGLLVRSRRFHRQDPRDERPPGGAYRFHMRSASGAEIWQQGIFREVVEPERFVRTCVWADAYGNPIGPETLMTVSFEAHEGKTKLTFQQVFETAADSEAHRIGTASALDRLAEYLATIE
jgi:uncharacterized protein YndB with AHSA1/START domain